MTTLETPVYAGIHHLRLPVSDLERSIQWYCAVLGARRLPELDHRRPEDGSLFAVILDVPAVGRVELRLDPKSAGELEGFAFLTMAVEDRAALDQWIDHLDALGIRHSPPIVALKGWVLVCADPDDLWLQFYTTTPHGLDPSRVEFYSPWLAVGPAQETVEQDTTVCAIGRLTVLPGHEDEVRELMHSVARATRDEDGCLAYRVHRTNDEFVVYEAWASADALDAHHRSAHMREFQNAAVSLVEWPPKAELLTPCD